MRLSRRSTLVGLASLAVVAIALSVLAVPLPGRAEGAATPAMTTAPTAPAVGGGFTGAVPRGGGIALLITSEDSDPLSLAQRLTAAGCNPSSIFLLREGVWIGFIVGAPAVVNLGFPNLLFAGTPFFVRCPEGGLAAFRYSITAESIGTLGTMTIDQTGEVVMPDREYFRLQLDLGGVLFDTEVITIGDRIWQRGDVPAPELGLSLAGYFDGQGGFTFDVGGDAFFDPAAVAALTTTEELVNGVDALRYELDGAQFEALFGAFVLQPGEEAPAVSLWLAKGLGVPVRIVIQSSVAGEPGSFRMEINVTDLNALDIAVQAPE